MILASLFVAAVSASRSLLKKQKIACFRSQKMNVNEGTKLGHAMHCAGQPSFGERVVELQPSIALQFTSNRGHLEKLAASLSPS